MMRLQQRDKKILLYLLKYKVATLYQVKEHLNLPSSRSAMQKRLKTLVRNKFLFSIYLENVKTYSLGEKGQKWLFQEGIIQKTYKLSHLGSVTTKLTHDLLLNDVIHSIERFDAVKQLTTHNQYLIQMDYSKGSQNIPDAIVTLSSNNHDFRCAVEIEISAKTKNRYEPLMYLYLKDKSLSAIFYIAGNQALKKVILASSRAFEKFQKNKIYVATVSDFLGNPTQCLFESASGKLLSLEKAAHGCSDEKQTKATLHSGVHTLCNVP